MSSLFDQPFEDDDEELAVAPPAAAPAPVRRVLTVTELTLGVRDLLEGTFAEVWVEGEISNCRLWNTGHMYFTLKDAHTQVRGVIFRSALRYLRFKPADGLRVMARGKISVYEPKGEYQIVCEHLEPHGFGARQLAFEQLKKRLQDEGLFDPARKRPLPALPRRIGIVTSLDGAAVRDILKVLGRRHANLSLVIRPVRVQGDGAAREIARGLFAVARLPDIDVVIVGRGGGSIEDLWAFNEEILARAIASCRVPVIAAVGHETDVTIADFVADLRAPTPSAAAELVVAASEELRTRVDRSAERLRAAARAHVQRSLRRLHTATGRPAYAGFGTRLALRGLHVSELTHTLTRAAHARIVRADREIQSLARRLDGCDFGRRLAGVRARLVAGDTRLERAMERRRHRADAALRACASRLESLSPLAVLGRGYAVCWTGDRATIVRDARTASPGDRVRVTLARGELECDVRETHDPGEGAWPKGS
jgi:exodeoxyribonuclease VII large subunit